MIIHIGGDHAAYELQRELVRWLVEEGHQVVDHGPLEYDAADDYPVFVLPAARAVAADPEARGIVLGGSGNGEQIAANKVAGVRAADSRAARRVPSAPTTSTAISATAPVTDSCGVQWVANRIRSPTGSSCCSRVPIRSSRGWPVQDRNVSLTPVIVPSSAVTK